MLTPPLQEFIMSRITFDINSHTRIQPYVNC